MNTSTTSPWGACRSRGGPFPRRSLEIATIVVGFIYAWPLAVAYVAWKIAGYPALDQIRDFARTGSWGAAGNGASRFAQAFEAARNAGPTGNWAFDEYRKAELERLEARRRALAEESRAFAEFVEELKRAKDREQFDAFMAKRRGSEGSGPTIDA
ncbi:DUF2852 domain-containing protein [Methylobacterium organophilum]|uniref:DUF2852 domain-containing protein n=1 Tax=Methylobacterium organophilum TaxID=410 RepID=UPI001F137177|nr:DUF2852 domain-containing protein [Methylobacterium organophilum]UMY17276.1 DUF2852 domain-containing protein [Methylobacterium organophilum]